MGQVEMRDLKWYPGVCSLLWLNVPSPVRSHLTPTGKCGAGVLTTVLFGKLPHSPADEGCNTLSRGGSDI